MVHQDASLSLATLASKGDTVGASPPTPSKNELKDRGQSATVGRLPIRSAASQPPQPSSFALSTQLVPGTASPPIERQVPPRRGIHITGPQRSPAAGPSGSNTLVAVATCKAIPGVSQGVAAQAMLLPPAPFPPVQCSRLEFQRCVADEIERLSLMANSVSKRQGTLRKLANQLRTCGTRFYGRKCACGQISGSIACSCGLRICPACEQYRLRRLATRILRIFPVFRGSATQVDLNLVTFRLRPDLASAVDLSIDGLRIRLTLLHDAISDFWAEGLRSLSIENRRPGMVVTTKVLPDGVLNAHAVLICRRLDSSTLKMIRSSRSGRLLFVDVEPVPADRLKEAVTVVSRIAQYICQGNSAVKGEVLYGTSAERLNPKLAARAEHAFSGRRIFDTFGVFRGLLDAEDGHRPVISKKCPRCSAEGLWTCVEMTLEEFFAASSLDTRVKFAPPPSIAHRESATLGVPHAPLDQVSGPQKGEPLR